MPAQPLIPIVEIFSSRQGEGTHTGRPAIFIRLAGCNLTCPWCDTDYTAMQSLTPTQILAEAQAHSPRSIILTGGEPLCSPHWQPLARTLKAAGYWLALETNATIALTPEQAQLFDHISASPKADIQLTHAHEVRLVADAQLTPQRATEIRATIQAADYYLSPCDDHGTIQWSAAAQLLGTLNAENPNPKWRLSIQLHKLAGFR